MEVIFGGVRGSQPVCAPGYAIYGGDTTSVLVSGRDGERIVIDAGTGVANLEPGLRDVREVMILFSHYHLDHLSGLPCFLPLYDKTRIVTMIGPAAGGGVENAVRGLLGPPYWPVPMDQMGAELRFVDFTGGDLCGEESHVDKPYVHGGLELRALAVHHPGGCLAWRVDEPATDRAVVFATDVEWRLMPSPRQNAFRTFCREPRAVDLLIMDGHYAADEYRHHAGWGHSSLDDVRDLGHEVGAGRVLVTHHAPENDDDELARRDAALADDERLGLARQGQVVALPEDPA